MKEQSFQENDTDILNAKEDLFKNYYFSHIQIEELT